jgi:hypothetical protein
VGRFHNNLKIHEGKKKKRKELEPDVHTQGNKCESQVKTPQTDPKKRKRGMIGHEKVTV